jgi:hypothetical protein
MIPFIFRFAQQIPPTASETLRYDAQRQITQILESGSWVDTPTARAKAGEDTRFTKVKSETTDDE